MEKNKLNLSRLRLQLSKQQSLPFTDEGLKKTNKELVQFLRALNKLRKSKQITFSTSSQLQTILSDATSPEKICQQILETQGTRCKSTVMWDNQSQEHSKTCSDASQNSYDSHPVTLASTESFTQSEPERMNSPAENIDPDVVTETIQPLRQVPEVHKTALKVTGGSWRIPKIDDASSTFKKRPKIIKPAFKKTSQNSAGIKRSSEFLKESSEFLKESSENRKNKVSPEPKKFKSIKSQIHKPSSIAVVQRSTEELIPRAKSPELQPYDYSEDIKRWKKKELELKSAENKKGVKEMYVLLTDFVKSAILHYQVVATIAFAKSPSQRSGMVIKCLQACGFKKTFSDVSVMRKEMKKHFQSHQDDSTWSGFCSRCSKQIVDLETSNKRLLTMENELEHIIEYHIKEKKN